MVRTRTLTIRDGREANFATFPMRRLFRKGDDLSKNDGSVAVRPVFPRELSRKNDGFPDSWLLAPVTNGAERFRKRLFSDPRFAESRQS